MIFGWRCILKLEISSLFRRYRARIDEWNKRFCCIQGRVTEYLLLYTYFYLFLLLFFFIHMYLLSPRIVFYHTPALNIHFYALYYSSLSIASRYTLYFPYYHNRVWLFICISVCCRFKILTRLCHLNDLWMALSHKVKNNVTIYRYRKSMCVLTGI